MEQIEQRHNRAFDIVYVATGVSLIAVCSWICIPTVVPFTLQTFAVFFVLLTFGGERGTLSVSVYVLMGAVGLPVFSGFKGGIAVLFGNTGGYILGFILMCIVYTYMTRMLRNSLFAEAGSLICGLVICYAFGTMWFWIMYMKNTGNVGIMTVMAWCVFPFVIPDLAKLALAAVISRRVKPVLNNYC